MATGEVRTKPWARWAGGTLGLVSILVGAFLTLHPFSSLAVLSVTVVVALIVIGLGELVAAGRTDGDTVDEDPGDDVWDTPARRRVRAGILFAAAIAILVWPGATIRVISVVLGVALIAGAVLDGLEARDAHGTRLWNAVLGAASGFVFGVLALAWPDISVLAVAVIFGIRLIIAGFRLIARSIRGRRHFTAASETATVPRVRGGGWRLVGNILALVVALCLGFLGMIVGDRASAPDAFYTAPASVPDTPGQLVRSEPFRSSESPEGAQAWRILYTTTRDESGAPALASGLVIGPATATDAPVPVIAWAHGTTGYAERCAPSLLDDGLAAGATYLQTTVADQGWAMVATDYTGLGTAGPQPYLIGQGEGRSVLDAVRAAHQLTDIRLSTQTVIWGHSQGGHAALWSGVLAPTYAPDLTIDGVAALAPASNLPGLVSSLDSVTGGEIFASFVVAAYTATYPDVSFVGLVRPGARIIIREMADRCLAEKSSLVSIATALALDGPIWNTSLDRGPIHDRLAANVPVGPIAAPVLIGQGADDTLITPADQAAYVKDRCDAGYAVDYRTYAGRDHVPLIEPDSPLVPDLVAWTADRFAGKPAGSTADHSGRHTARVHCIG